MTRTLTTKLLLLGWMVLGLLQMRAQGWEKKYSPDVVMGINSLYQLPDGSYITSGADYTGNKQRLMHIDVNGSVLGQYDFDSINIAATNIAQNNSYVMIGLDPYDTGTAKRFKLLRVSASGQGTWLANIDTGYYPAGQSVLGDMAVDTTNNGGFICTENPFQAGNYNFYQLRVRRVDGNGNLLWSNSYFDLDSSQGTRYAYDIRSVKDGGFIVMARLSSQGPNIIFKIDSAGNQLWTYDEPFADSGIVAAIARDGNILISGAGYIGKLDLNGNVLWLHQYPALQNSMDWGGRLVEKNDSVFALIGAHAIGGANNGFNYSFVEADTAGNVLYQTNIATVSLGPAQLYSQGYRNLIMTADKGYLFGGWMAQDAQNYSGYLIKMDSNGHVYNSNLSGYAYLDSNADCVRENSEMKLKLVTLSFASARDTFNIVTDDSGYYALPLDTVTYHVSVASSLHYTFAGNCGTDVIKLPANTDSVVSFAAQPTMFFPYITMSAYNLNGTCNSSAQYTLQYCNTGTALFTGVIDISMDSLFVFESASLPLLSQTGGVYSFKDTLGIDACHTLQFYYNIPCGLHLSGTTSCINAHAYSDTVVANPSSGWDHSNLQLKAACNQATDSVTFMLKNAGTGGMQHNEDLIVIEDNVILSITPVALIPNQLKLISLPANGSTWRMTIRQTPENPYSAFTTAFNEGCGIGVAHQLGYINQFPNNGFYGFDYTLCSVVAGSFDPNHKSVLPAGAGNDHIIDTSTVLEYTIEFQNTGTAAASNIRIVDTLAPYLNPLTLKPGASSFPYNMQFLANNVVAFTFSNINLPDTAVSQPASQGFVKFSISQNAGNSNGTVINNEAAIFFDYNAGVITNIASVSVGQLLFTDIQSVYNGKQLLINAYPNPFSTEAVIKVTGETFSSLQLNVYDLTGRLVKQQRVQNAYQFIINRSALETGSYLFEITNDGKPVGRGKIVAQ